MKPTETDQADINTQYRTIRVLWFAICLPILFFLAIIYMSPVAVAENRQLSLVLNGIGVIPVAMSFLLKQKLLAKSIETQRLDLVQKAYVLSFALCESSALFGLTDHSITGSKFYYFSFAIAGLGLFLHFPQKQNLVNASSYRQL